MWARNGRWILPEMPDFHVASFTCRKSTTWDRRLYFPSEGRRVEDFFTLKNPTASAMFEPANLGTKGQHATSRPPKPLHTPLDVNALHKFLYPCLHGYVITLWWFLHEGLLRLQFFKGDLHAAENIHEITQWVNKKSLIPGINHES